MILDDKLIAACMVAEKENGTHPAVQGVLLRDGKAVGTDGFKLIEMDLPEQITDTKEFPNTGNEYLIGDDAVLPADPLRKALSNIPKRASLPILTKAITAKGAHEDSVKVVSTDLETTHAPDITKLKGEFPSYKQVLEKVADRPTAKKVKVNTKYLVELLQAFLKAESRYIVLEVGEALEALKITGAVEDEENGRKITGLLMPISQ